MGLVELARKTFDSRPKLSPEQIRKARPLRNPNVTSTVEANGALVLEAPLADQERGFWGLVARWMKAPNTKKFELEPIGAFLWELIDGQNTFEALSRKLRDRYKMNRVEADTSLSAFLQMLSSRGLIVMMVGKEQ